jgi:hypothetical protein
VTSGCLFFNEVAASGRLDVDPRSAAVAVLVEALKCDRNAATWKRFAEVVNMKMKMKMKKEGRR